MNESLKKESSILYSICGKLKKQAQINDIIQFTCRDYRTVFKMLSWKTELWNSWSYLRAGCEAWYGKDREWVV